MTSSAAAYLGVDRYEQEVGVEPDADDGDLPVEAGAQLVAHVGPNQSHAPEAKNDLSKKLYAFLSDYLHCPICCYN